MSDPTNPIDLIIRLLLLFVMLFFIGVQSPVMTPPGQPPNQPPAVPPSAPPANPGDGDAQGNTRTYLLVEDIEFLVMESYPYQVSMTVQGQWRDGCDTEVFVEQRRDGDTITVEVFQRRGPAMSCIAVMQPDTVQVRLEGGFESGTYTIQVNEFSAPLNLD